MYRKKTIGRTPEENDGKRWFTVNVTETYNDSVLVRAFDEDEACETVNDLVNSDKYDPALRGEYERSVDPCRLIARPSEGEEYWEADE